MSLTTILLTTLSALAAATPLTPRAGGPAIVPIPSDCKTTNPLPSTSGNKPTPDTLYTQFISSGESTSKQAQTCFEQCYGFGTPGSCKAAVFALNVPTPKGYYGTEGGVLEASCMMFSDYLDESQFEAAPAGQYTNETAMNIYCQRS